MNRGKITTFLRALNLMHLVDKTRFYILKIQKKNPNRAFLKENPTVKLPPDYLMYESFQIDYKKYFKGGLDTAKWLKNILSNHIELKNKKVLDWGCGPARVIRHFPGLDGNNCEFFGTDYNHLSIEWCENNISDVLFQKNEIVPPLNYQDNFFDVIYGLSIFTHLSEENHMSWYNELIRVTKKGGVLLLTTQGKAFKGKLIKSELSQFKKGQIVIRGKVTEGHRTFSAFHPPQYVRDLFEKQALILEHIEGKKQEWGISQDVWIIQKK